MRRAAGGNRRWLALASLAALGLLATAVDVRLRAQAPAAATTASTPADAAKALLAVRDADPLELARVAQRVRDRAVLALLVDTQPVAVRIAAMRASPWLAEPELALAPLPAWVASRDGALAEAAARAAFAIARTLDVDALKRREVDRAALAGVVTALQAIERSAPWVRADLIALANAAALQLEAAGIAAAVARPVAR